MTPEEIERLKALAEKATPGPWTERSFDECQRCIVAPLDGKRRPLLAIVSIGPGSLDPTGTSNPAFIAATREAVPALIAELERARELLDLAHEYTESSDSGLYQEIAAFLAQEPRKEQAR